MIITQAITRKKYGANRRIFSKSFLFDFNSIYLLNINVNKTGLSNGSVAQLVEQQPFKLMVAGSIPARPTM